MRYPVLLSLLLVSAARAQDSSELRINQLQMVGTHNSYHAGFAPSEAKLWEAKNPKMFRSLDYRHQPLPAQLDAGIRQVEIDVFYDPKGGRFAHPRGIDMVKAAGLPADPAYDPNHDMEKPGFKVMHVQDVDQRSTCPLFVSCLQQIHTWSQSHRDHLPIFILVETKEGGLKSMPEAKEALPFTAPVFKALETEILSVFDRHDIITPDDVRGKYETLPEAIAHNGWPTVQAARGKVVFLLDQRSAESIYTEGHKALQGRLMFTNAVPGLADAAFTEENGAPATEINTLVKKGYLVRTRTDEPTEQARTNNTTRRDAVLSSGAQILSTDYPASEPATWSGYAVAFPGGKLTRCNPLNTTATCRLTQDGK